MRAKLILVLVFLASLLVGVFPEERITQRRICHFSVTTDPVPAYCMHYGWITNTNAGGAVVLELAPFAIGMDFIVSNVTGESFSISPDGTDRFLAPATDAAGDKMTSTVQGDSVRFMAPAGNQAQEIFNTGGWVDDGA
jgi:hypothetical protein